MIKLDMDCLHLYFVKCSSSGSHKGLYFLVGDLKGVSSVCVLQWGNLLFLVQTVFTTSPPPQFTNSQLSCSKFLFIITSYFDNDVFYVHEIVLTYF